MYIEAENNIRKAINRRATCNSYAATRPSDVDDRIATARKACLGYILLRRHDATLACKLKSEELLMYCTESRHCSPESFHDNNFVCINNTLNDGKKNAVTGVAVSHFLLKKRRHQQDIFQLSSEKQHSGIAARLSNSQTNGA